MSVVEFSADSWQASSPGLQKGLANRIEALTALGQGLESLAASGNISGRGAEAMRAYIREVHVPIVQCLLVGLQTFQTAIGVYWQGYSEVDTGGNFRLVNDEFDEHLTRVDTGMEELRGFADQLRSIAASASHLVSLGGAGANAAERTASEFERMHLIARTQQETWKAYEATDPGFDQVKALLAELNSIVNNVGNLTVGQGRSYTAGSFNLTLQQLGSLTGGMLDYCQKNQQVASDGWEALFTGYVDDVEAEAERQRKEDALWGLLWDGLQIVAGVLIVAVGVVGTPFSAGTTLALAGLGGSLIVGGVNSAINHASIATTGDELNLIGMASEQVGQWYDVNVMQPAVESGSWGGQLAAGIGSGVGQVISGAAQLNVRDTGRGIEALIFDEEVRNQAWKQLTGFVDQVRAGNPVVIGQIVGNVLPGAAALKIAKTSGLLGQANKVPDFGKPIITTPSNTTSALDWLKGTASTVSVTARTQVRNVLDKLKSTGHSGDLKHDEGNQDIGSGTNSNRQTWRYSDPQVQALRDTLDDAVRQKNLPGYDPTGGLGWERFMDKYLAGFDVDGRPIWNWPDNPPHANGFTDGVSKPADLKRGDTIERITFLDDEGKAADGRFAAPPGTTFDQLSLPPDRLGGNTTVVQYEILKPLPDNVRMGEIAPGFEQDGRGTQYHFPGGIKELERLGYIKEIS